MLINLNPFKLLISTLSPTRFTISPVTPSKSTICCTERPSTAKFTPRAHTELDAQFCIVTSFIERSIFPCTSRQCEAESENIVDEISTVAFAEFVVRNIGSAATVRARYALLITTFAFPSTLTNGAPSTKLVPSR